MKYTEQVLQDFNVLMNDIAALDPRDYQIVKEMILSLIEMHEPKEER